MMIATEWIVIDPFGYSIRYERSIGYSLERCSVHAPNGQPLVSFTGNKAIKEAKDFIHQHSEAHKEDKDLLSIRLIA